MIPHPASDELPSAAHEEAGCAQQCRRVLHELIDIGTERARVVHGQAMADGAGPVLELAAAFDRIARAVRRCIALALVLSESVPSRAAARRRVAREVEESRQRRAGGSEGEAMGGERPDRLDAPDLDGIGDRPVDEIIAGICRDLGVAAVPGTAAGLATLRARGASPAVTEPPGGGQPGSSERMPLEAMGAASDSSSDPGSPPCDRGRSGPRLAAPAMHALVVPTGSDGGSGVTGNPTTPLLHAARFRGK